MKSRRFALGLALSLLACNGTTPPPAVPPGGGAPEDSVIAGPGGSGVVVGEVDVSPVTAPGAVVFHLRWKSPQATVDAAASYAQVPPDMRAQLMREGARGAVDEALGDQVDVNAFADVLALDAPVDLVLIADTSAGGQIPEPIVAVSVGLASIERALAASKGRPAKIAEGVWRIGTQDKDAEPCAVVAAAGKAPARLVCSESESQLAKVAPFVARNVATLPDPPRDLQAKLELRPILDKYGRNWANQARGLPVLAQELQIGVASFDEALMSAADAIAQEAGALIHDADSIVLDAGFEPQKGLDLGLELRFVGKQSWLVSTMLDGADQQGPPPEMFWKLPADAATASYGHGGNPTNFEPILKTARILLEGILEKEQIGTAADRQALGKLLRVPWGKHVTFVSASGHFDAPAKPAGGMMEELLGSSVGWYVMGFDEPSAKVRAYFDDVQRAYNRPAFQKALKQEMGSDAKHLPVMKVVRAPAALGAGGYDLMIQVPDLEEPSLDPDGKAKTIDLEMHVLVMSDGNQTWAGFALDRDALAAMMAKLKGAGQGPMLAGKASLAPLKGTKHAGATVITLDGILDGVKPLISAFAPLAGSGAQGEQALNILGQLPNQGDSPMVTVIDVLDGPKPRVSFKLNVPKATLQDVGFLVTKLIELEQSAP